MALPQVGLEAVILGMSQFLAETKRITAAYDDIDKKSGDVEKGAASLSTQFVSLGDSLLKFGAIAGTVVVGAVATLGAALTGFAVGGIQKAADLDQKMADIAATMGIAKDQAAGLKQLALDLALDPNLTVSATQAAEAIEVLAANGADLVDELGNVTEAGRTLTTQVVAMSNATGADFALSAAIATDAANIFKVAAEDMGKVVDGAAGVMVASKFDAEDYALALANAGSVASGMGVDIEDFNTVIAGTASQFASGGDAGTSFKAVLQRLAKPTDEMQEAMNAYGISLFDADGNMRDMAEVAGQLNAVFNGTATITSTTGGVTEKMAKAAESAEKKMGPLNNTIGEQQAKLSILQQELVGTIEKYGEGSTQVQNKRLAIQKLTNNISENQAKYVEYQAAINAVTGAQAQTVTTTKELTEAEKANLAAMLGGADGARILLGLAGMTEQQFRDLSAEVNETGQGLKAAATRVDSFKGAMDIFSGVMEAIQIQVGDKFLPILRGITVGFTDLASRVGPMVVDFFGKVASSIGTAINFGSKVAESFMGGFSDAFSETGSIFEGVFSGISSVLGQIFKVDSSSPVFAFFTAIETLATTIFGDMASNATSLGGVIKNALGAGLAFLTDTILPALTTAILFVNEHWAEFKGAIIGVGAVLAGAAIASIIAAIGAAIAALATPIAAIIAVAALLGAAWAGNWGDIQGKTKAVIKIIREAMSQIVKAIQPIIKKVMPELLEVWQLISKKTQEVWPLIQKTIEKVMSAIQSIIETVTKFIESIWTKHGDELKSTASVIWDAIWRNIKGIIENIADLIKLTLQVITGDWEGAWETIKDISARTWQGIKDNINSVLQIISNLVSSIMGGIQSTIQTIWNNIKQTIETAVNNIKSAVQTGFDAIKSTISSILNNIQSTVTTIWNNIKSAIQTAIDNIKNAVQTGFSNLLSSISSTMTSILNSISNTWSSIVTAVQTKVQTIVSSVVTAFTGLVSSIAGFATQMFNAAVTMVTGIINGITSKLQAIKDALVNTMTSAIDFFTSAVEAGSSLATKLLNAGKDVIQKVVDGIKEFVGLGTELIDKISSGVISLVTSITSGTLFTKLKDAGGDIISGITQGLRNAGDAVWDTLRGIIDDAIGSVYDYFGINSPSTLMMGIGQDLMKGLQVGLASMAPAINAQFQASLFSPVASVAGPALASSSVVNNYNTYQLGGNTFNGGDQMNEAIFEARVMRVLQRALS